MGNSWYVSVVVKTCSSVYETTMPTHKATREVPFLNQYSSGSIYISNNFDSIVYGII